MEALVINFEDVRRQARPRPQALLPFESELTAYFPFAVSSEGTGEREKKGAEPGKGRSFASPSSRGCRI